MAVRVTGPEVVKVPAGMVKTQLVALVQGLVPIVWVIELEPAPESVMVPLATPADPLTETVTLRLLEALMLEDCGVTVIDGVASPADAVQ